MSSIQANVHYVQYMNNVGQVLPTVSGVTLVSKVCVCIIIIFIILISSFIFLFALNTYGCVSEKKLCIASGISTVCPNFGVGICLVDWITHMH